jgi:hypothetical protein
MFHSELYLIMQWILYHAIYNNTRKRENPMPGKAKAPKPHALVVRFPVEIDTVLADLALREYRSLSGQVITLVQEALDARTVQKRDGGKRQAPLTSRGTGIPV